MSGDEIYVSGDEIYVREDEIYVSPGAGVDLSIFRRNRIRGAAKEAVRNKIK